MTSPYPTMHLVKKVITKGKYIDYWNKIQSYELGFTPYRLHTNVDGNVTPVRGYDGDVYVLDHVATMEFGGRQIETDKISSKQLMGVAAWLCKEIEDPLELKV